MTSAGPKTLALGTATSLLAWSAQQLALGNTTVAGTGFTIGLAILTLYQLAEETSHSKAYEEFVDAVGEDTLKELAELSADQINDRLAADSNTGE